MITVGTRVYALGAFTLGAVGLAWGEFALQWQPVAAGIPGRTVLAYLFAAALVGPSIAANWQRSAAAGAATLCGLFTAVVVLLHVPRVATHLLNVGAWNGLAEQLVLACGGLLAWSLSSEAGSRRAEEYRRVGQLAFGGCLLIFGLAHFSYLDFTASMVPPWIPPGQRFWAAATGIAHIAAGLAMLTGTRARLAAVLLTVMFALFGILIHAPLLLADPHSHLNWVMNAMNLALTGAAWTLADSLRAAHVPIATAESHASPAQLRSR